MLFGVSGLLLLLLLTQVLLILLWVFSQAAVWNWSVLFTLCRPPSLPSLAYKHDCARERRRRPQQGRPQQGAYIMGLGVTPACRCRLPLRQSE